MFIRKRDPRYKSHLAHQAQLAAAALKPKPKPASGSSTPRPTTYVEQEWQRVLSVDAGLEWAVAEGTEDPEVFECVVCGKSFKSEAAWDSHERSKKHLKAVEMLRLEMEVDVEELGLELQEEEDDDANSDDGDADSADGIDGDVDEQLDEVYADAKDGLEVVEEPPRSPTPQVDTPPSPTPPPEALPEDIAPQEETRELTPEPKTKKSRRKQKTAGPVEEPLTKTARLALERQQEQEPLEAEVEAEAPNELSKREKRRAREAAKKAQPPKEPELVRSCLLPISSQTDHIAAM